MVDAKTIGNRLKKLRGGRKMEDVSNAIGISRSALSMYECGQRIPRDEIKVKIATFYNTSIETIFFAS